MMDKNFLPPEERALARQLEALSQRVVPDPSFERELEKQLMHAHSSTPRANGLRRAALPALGWAIGMTLLVLTLNWILRSLAPSPQPASNITPTPLEGTPLPDKTRPPITPEGKAYNWRGMTLTLLADLPDSPKEAFVYEYQPPRAATLDDARTLAAQLGMSGAIYNDEGALLIVDGNRRLRISSSQSFEYLPDYSRYPRWRLLGNSPAVFPPNAGEQIQQFLAEHGFTFDYTLRSSALYNAYFVSPLTPDGYPIFYEYFRCAGMEIELDAQGVVYVGADLPAYKPITPQPLSIIHAEEALQRMLDPNPVGGLLEGSTHPGGNPTAWYRPYPLDRSITFYGWLDTFPSAEGGAPLVTLDGYLVTGNTAGIPASLDNTFVEARGQFHEQDGIRTFELESWKARKDYMDGLTGTIEAEGEHVVLRMDGETLLLPDVPPTIPLPLENAYVLGVREGETFNWASIDLRMHGEGGGGGGGGGLGFYKLNLTGTPVPFVTPIPALPFGGGGGGGGGGDEGGGGGGGSGGQTYIVQEGDTLSKIAEQFGVTLEALMQANDISDSSMIYVGQTLIIPVPDSSVPQKVEGARGMLSITIYKQKAGDQRVEYLFLNQSTPYSSLPLEGENLEALQAYQNRPVDVWGTIETRQGQPVLKMDRYEIPFPDLQFRILRGTQRSATIEGQTAALFTTSEGKTYVQLAPYGGVVGSTVGNPSDEVLIEALLIPDETFGGYPALRIFAAQTTANSPEALKVTADQIYIVDEASSPYALPTAAIERVELVYYMPNPLYIQGELGPDQRYIQPAWLFRGHYSDGTEFFVLVQALKQEFLLPEIAPYTPPG